MKKAVQIISILLLAIISIDCSLANNITSATQSAEISGSSQVCILSTGNVYTTITIPGASSYQWTVPSGASLTSGQGTTSITVDYPAGSVSGSVTVAGISTSVTYSLDVTVNGEVPVITGPTDVCKNQIMAYSTQPGKSNYTWTVLGGSVVSGVGTNSVTVKFTVEGVRSVKVTYKDGSCTLENTLPVNVLTTAISIGGNQKPVVGQTCTYTCTGTGAAGATNFVWSFVNPSDGQIVGGGGPNDAFVTILWTYANQFSHVYLHYTPTPNPYPCSLTDGDLPICIEPTTTGPGIACKNSSGNIYYTEAGMTNYNWVVTGGTIVSGAGTNTISIDWYAAGNQTISVSYTNNNGPSFVHVKTVTVNPDPVVVISGLTTVCGGTTNTYTATVTPATPTPTHLWSIVGNGTIVGAINTATVTVMSGGTGTFTLTDAVTLNTCTSASDYVVSVNSPPVCQITGPGFACPEGTVYYSAPTSPAGLTYLWSISGNGGSIVGSTTSSTVAVLTVLDGSFTLTLTLTNADGCTSQCSTDAILISCRGHLYPPCDISGNNSPCSSATITYNGPDGVTSYTWTIDGDAVINGPADGKFVSVTPGPTGSYTLYLTTTDEFGAASKCSRTVIIPTCTIDGPDQACNNSAGNIYTGPAGLSYNWSVTGNGQIIGSTTGSSVTVTAGASGTYTVSLTTTNIDGCSSTCTKTATVTTCTETRCFSSSAVPPNPNVSAQMSWTFNADNTVTIRTTFAKTFVDNTYGTNVIGWPGAHKFTDLTGSDKLQLALYDANNVKKIEFKMDYITATSTAPSGYKSLGVTGGDGGMILGNASDIVSVLTSLDKNFNAYGYILTTNSPATNSSYAPNPTYPNWIYDVWYEVTVKMSVFGSAGFGEALITSVHASPSKTGNNTEPVGPCPELSAVATGTNVSCNATCNGSVDLTVSNGVQPYTYLWSPGGATTQDITNLCPGTYSVVVTDAAGATATASAVISGAPSNCSGSECFSSSATPPNPNVGAQMTWTVNADNTITIRTTFAKTFVDNTYGTNVIGWPGAHKFTDLTGSDKLQLALYDANNVKVIEFKMDYITATTTVPSGFKSLGVTGGDGGMILGNASDVVSVLTSLDKNFNAYGYILTTNSPATNSSYAPNPTYPNWIYDVWYEVTVKMSVFGSAGFGEALITSVHASPSKTGNNTEPVGPCLPLAAVAVATNVSCNATCNGSIDLTVTNGTPPYFYSWSNGQTTQDISGLCPGTYTVTVIDAVGTVVNTSAVVSGAPSNCSGNQCFSSSATPPNPNVGAQMTWTVNADNTITIRTTFAKTFVDNTYGTNVIGWPAAHKFTDLTGSDKLQLALYNANNVKVIEFKMDYITATTTAPSGYKSLGVTGGDGGMILGSASDVVSVLTSLDKNFNTYGYILTTNSPATNSSYAPNATYPNWIYDVWYEVTVKMSVFGSAGFGQALITSVHASPSKTGNNTEPVTPCPPLTVVANGTNVTCNSTSCDGSVTLTVSNGVQPYTYAWSNGATTQNLTGLCAGTYSVVVTDAAGATASASEVISGSSSSCSGTECFQSSATPPNPNVGAQMTWTINADNTVTIRTTFAKTFVDNTYGTNVIGWPGAHKFTDLTGSDKLQLALYDANDVKKIEFKMDYITATTTVPSGFKSLGVTGGDGGMILGNASDVVSVLTSLDKNFNAYGYILTTNSPATNSSYAPNATYPNWIYDVWYECTVKMSVFGSAGFGQALITSVHASPSKTGNNTEPVTLCTNKAVTPGTDPTGKDNNVQIDISIVPNPVLDNAEISFSVSKDTHATLEFYNYMGVKIATLCDYTISASNVNTYTLRGSGIPDGIYLVILRTNYGSKAARVIIAH